MEVLWSLIYWTTIFLKYSWKHISININWMIKILACFSSVTIHSFFFLHCSYLHSKFFLFIKHLYIQFPFQNSKVQKFMHPNFKGLEYNISNSATLNDGILMCSKYTATLNKKKMVILGCDLIDYSFGCISSTTEVEEHGKKYTASVSLDGVTATDAIACFCQNDHCNGPHPENSTTTTSVPITSTTQKSRATGSHLTSYSLFTATIAYFMYKCVS